MAQPRFEPEFTSEKATWANPATTREQLVKASASKVMYALSRHLTLQSGATGEQSVWTARCWRSDGHQTIYKLALPNDSQVVLHSFAAGTDGWNPEGPLIIGPNGALYGTTQDGGNQGCQLGFGSVGCGIVFEGVR